jgi:predicted metal-dependent hydrolase
VVTKIQLGEIEAEVTFKTIKNVHLSVHPPLGRVRIAAPSHMKLDTVRVFAISKLGCIKQQQRKLAAQERETSRDYVNRESHHVWIKRMLLTVVEKDQPPTRQTRRLGVLRTEKRCPVVWRGRPEKVAVDRKDYTNQEQGRVDPM